MKEQCIAIGKRLDIVEDTVSTLASKCEQVQNVPEEESTKLPSDLKVCVCV